MIFSIYDGFIGCNPIASQEASMYAKPLEQFLAFCKSQELSVTIVIVTIILLLLVSSSTGGLDCKGLLTDTLSVILLKLTCTKIEITLVCLARCNSRTYVFWEVKELEC
jgi:hypothetical protein